MIRQKLAADIEKKINAIKNLSKEKNNQQIQNKTIARKIGFSASDLSGAKNPDNKIALHTLKRILDALIQLERDCKLRPDECADSSGMKKHLELTPFFNTTWALYFYHQKENKEGVARAVLTIENKKLFHIKNIDGEDQTDYEGTEFFSYKNDQYLFFDFHTKDNNEKFLRIIVIRGEGKKYPLMAGFFTNINSKGALVTGTVILQEKTKSKFKPLFFEKKKDQSTGESLDTEVWLYLKEKHLNSLKVTTGLNSLALLHNFLEQKGKIRKNQEKKEEQQQNIDLFISAPMTGLDNEEFHELKKKIKRIEEAIKEGYRFESFYFAGNSVTNISLPNASDKALTNATEHIRKSTRLMLFIDRQVQSSSFVEIGFALAEISCTIFTSDKNYLPYMLRQDSQNQFIKRLKVYEFPDFEVLLAMLSEQKYTL